jgi:hypothetical protein
LVLLTSRQAMKYVSGVLQNKKTFYGIFLFKKSENRCSSLAAERGKKVSCNQRPCEQFYWPRWRHFPSVLFFVGSVNVLIWLLWLSIFLLLTTTRKSAGRSEIKITRVARWVVFFTWGTLKSHQLMGCDFYDDEDVQEFIVNFLCQTTSVKFIFLM